MPWFIDEKNCVVAGTKEDPGEKVKCHASKPKALAHMQALYANVEDVKEIITDSLYTFKQGEERRFVAIVTIEKIDIDGEAFTTEAQDYAIQAASKEAFPQLRVFHIRGMKIGDADKGSRFGKFLVFEGRYDDTTQAKEIDRLVQDPNSGLKTVSGGFSVVEATGKCPCGARLLVGPVGLKAFFKCPKCGEIYKGSALSGVKFTKAKIFDITVTDRPAVRGTAIASFGIIKESNMVSREVLKTRLVENGFDPTIADEWLKSIPDEDLERMKEDSVVELFKEALAEVAKEDKPADKKPDEDEPMDAEMKGGIVKCKCGQRLRIRGGMEKETGEFEIDFAPLQEMIEKTVAAQFKEIQIELPDFDGRFVTLETAIKELTEATEHKVEDAAAELLKDSSPSTRTRLIMRMRTKEQEEERQKENTPTGTGIMDAAGKEYPTMTAMFEEGG